MKYFKSWQKKLEIYNLVLKWQIKERNEVVTISECYKFCKNKSTQFRSLELEFLEVWQLTSHWAGSHMSLSYSKITVWFLSNNELPVKCTQKFLILVWLSVNRYTTPTSYQCPSIRRSVKSNSQNVRHVTRMEWIHCSWNSVMTPAFDAIYCHLS